MQIPSELSERLDNWGRWGRGCHHWGQSWLAKYQIPNPDEPQKEHRSFPADEQDALLVNAAWRSMPDSSYDDRRAKFLIAAMYSSTSGLQFVLVRLRKECKIRVRPGEVESLMERAVKFIGRKLGYVIY